MTPPVTAESEMQEPHMSHPDLTPARMTEATPGDDPTMVPTRMTSAGVGLTPSTIASGILIEATAVSHRIGEGDLPDPVHAFLWKEITAALAATPPRDERVPWKALEEATDGLIKTLEFAISVVPEDGDITQLIACRQCHSFLTQLRPYLATPAPSEPASPQGRKCVICGGTGLHTLGECSNCDGTGEEGDLGDSLKARIRALEHANANLLKDLSSTRRSRDEWQAKCREQWERAEKALALLKLSRDYLVETPDIGSIDRVGTEEWLASEIDAALAGQQGEESRG